MTKQPEQIIHTAETSTLCRMGPALKVNMALYRLQKALLTARLAGGAKIGDAVGCSVASTSFEPR